MTSRASRFSGFAAVALLAFALLWHAWWTTRAWAMPGLSGHEFRQTQTAISIWAMKDDGFRLDYSTPILGKPWSIPFEFPLYQGAAAAVSKLTGLNAVQSGRWVSLISFYLALPPLLLLLRRAGLSPVGAVLALLPVLFAPVYILYTRAVLIESSALCASAWFLYCLMAWRASRSQALLVAALLTGIAAVLIKATTWWVACVPWGLCWLADAWKQRRAGRAAFVRLMDEIVLVVGPVLLVGLGWVWIADRIKEMNPVGAFLTSDKMAGFTFGTLAQRFDGAAYRAVWHNWTTAITPGWVVALAAVAFVFTTQAGRRVALIALLAFLAGPLVFMNLYAIHDYYFYANAAGVCLAIGAVAAAAWDAPRRWYAGPLPAIIVLVAFCAGEFQNYRAHFYPVQVAENGGNSGLTDALRRLTKPGEVIVMHSPDWSAILPFRAERRMLIIPDSQMYYRPEEVQRGVDLLKDESVPLLIVRDQSRIHVDWLEQRIHDFKLRQLPLFTWQNEATVYARRDRFAEMRTIIEQGNFSGVSLGRPPQEVKYRPSEPVRGTAKAGELSMLSPSPVTISTPYYGFRSIEGRGYLFTHPPTEIVFEVPADATRLEIGYRAHPEVYEHKEFDGAYVEVELTEPGRPPIVVHEEWLTREGNRSARNAVEMLPKHGAAKLTFRALPGPANNDAYDWILLEYLRVR